MKATVLLYGADSTLLHTRAMVLEMHGFRAIECGHLEEVERVAAEEPVAVLVLCHTLPFQDQEVALARVKRVRPGVKCVGIMPYTNRVQGPRDAVASMSDGPLVVVEAVRRVLGF